MKNDKQEKDFFLEKLLAWLRYKKVIKHIPKNSIVCDIGCGANARFLKCLNSLIKYGIGFDKKAEDFKNERLEIQKLEIGDKIPLNTESADVVTMLAVLEHIKNPQKVLNESFRILRKGGKLILTTPTPLARPVLNFLAFKLNLINQRQIKEHQNYFYPGQIKKMLVLAGFEEKNIKLNYFEFGFNNLAIATK